MYVKSENSARRRRQKSEILGLRLLHKSKKMRKIHTYIYRSVYQVVLTS